MGRVLLTEWSDLEWLVQQHEVRQTAWQKAPPVAISGHVLLSVLKGKNSLDKLWGECIAESSPPDVNEEKGRDATRLGDGEPWRFQAGAPFIVSDLPPLVSIGSLTGVGANRAWTAASGLRHDATGRRVFLKLDATGDAP